MVKALPKWVFTAHSQGGAALQALLALFRGCALPGIIALVHARTHAAVFVCVHGQHVLQSWPCKSCLALPCCCQVGDGAGPSALAALTGLEVLDLSCSKLCNEGLMALATLGKLRELVLDMCRVGDEGCRVSRWAVDTSSETHKRTHALARSLSCLFCVQVHTTTLFHSNCSSNFNCRSKGCVAIAQSHIHTLSLLSTGIPWPALTQQ